MSTKTHRQPLRMTARQPSCAPHTAERAAAYAAEDEAIADIARAHLFIDDVHAKHGSDRLDFTSVGHASLVDALRAAFELGRSAGITAAAAKIGR
jgi:hypothetical protein